MSQPFALDLTSCVGDVHKAAAQVKGHMPGRGINAEAEAKQYGQAAGAKIDSAVSHTFFVPLDIRPAS